MNSNYNLPPGVRLADLDPEDLEQIEEEFHRRQDERGDRKRDNELFERDNKQN
jgi:hypothetical protein